MKIIKKTNLQTNTRHTHPTSYKTKAAIGIALTALLTAYTSQALALQQVTVNVTATDAVNTTNPLHYAWQVSEGSITHNDAPTATWTIPAGAGVHFANVLVSNRLGGYTERRLALISDNLGIPSVLAPVKDFTPPLTNTNSIQSSETEFVVASDSNYITTNTAGTGIYGNGTGTFKKAVYIPDITVNYTDWVSNIVYQAKTDLGGRISVWNSGHPICCDDGEFPYGHPHTHVNQTIDATGNITGNTTPYIVGTAVLKDGNPCGLDNKFQGVQSTATAQLLDAKKMLIGSTVRANKYGDYALPYNPNAAYVKVACENNPALTVAINKTTSVAAKAVFTQASAPIVSNMTASLGGQILGANGPVIAKFLPPDTGLPSSKYPRTDQFLAFKGQDNKISACRYYLTTGAVKTCDAAGNPSGAVTFQDWQAKVGLGNYRNKGVFTGQNATEYSATYINRMDLNLTRRHHAITYPTKTGNSTAAYVCNHLGPASPSQTDVNTAINNAINGLNLVACVAMDYGYELANGAPYVRFFTFSANGQLLLSVNLDGRGEKYIPGTCVACHGGKHYDGQIPVDDRPTPDIGAHFLPYDVNNFLFSNTAGLTRASQETAIYNLNKIAKTTNLNDYGLNLINGWYHNDTQTTTDTNYLPDDWQAGIGTLPGIDVAQLYHKVEAPYCRSCHVAMDSERVTNNPEAFHFWEKTGSPNRDDSLTQVICGGPSTVQRNHTMPNSLVTFNNLWADPTAVALLKKWSNDNNCLNHPDPKLN